MSITPAERKAVLFLASLLTLGAAARFAGALHQERVVAEPLPVSGGLAAQIAAVDSERSLERTARQRQSRYNVRRMSRPRAGRSGDERDRRDSSIVRDSIIVIDVDRASTAELELLPRVGPALAQRIVHDREEHGPFGSLEGLIRVKGIGPKLVTHIAKHVTFSGSVRPSTALSVSLGSSPRAGRPPPPG